MGLLELAGYAVIAVLGIAFLKASSTAKLVIIFLACLCIGAVVLVGPALTMGVSSIQTTITAIGG